MTRPRHDVVFDFPPPAFQEQTFQEVREIRAALRMQQGELKAAYTISSNARYVSLICKAPKCLSKMSYKIERPGNDH